MTPQTRLEVNVFKCPFCKGTFLRQDEGVHQHLYGYGAAKSEELCPVFRDTNAVKVVQHSEYEFFALVADEGMGVWKEVYALHTNGLEVRTISNHPEDINEALDAIRTNMIELQKELNRLADLVHTVEEITR